MSLENEKSKMMLLAGLAEAINFGKKDLSFIEIINKYDYLKKAFKYVVLNNKSNGAPYHNLNHLLTVMKAIYDCMQSEGLGKDSKLKEMLILGLFHDFNHSAGKKTDDKNIEDAKKTLKIYFEQEDKSLDLDFMNEVLDATQYPYVIEKEKLNKYQSIIRDADIVQVLQYNWIHQSVFGLSQEIGMSFVDFIKAQKKFIENVEFNTDWGKKLKKENWKRVIRETNLLEEIFK